jgi:hypothetical protein
MEINQEVIKKIKFFIVKKNAKDLSANMPSQGKHVFEADYDLAVNENVSDLVFVVSVKTFYGSSRIEDKKYGIYAFDKNTGEEVKDFEKTDKCYFNFFNDLTVIENIL